MDEPAILGGIAPELMPRKGSARERRRHISRTLNRIERAGGIEPERRDSAALQRVAYAESKLGRELVGISSGPGWNPERPETRSQLLATARQLELQSEWLRARADAGMPTPAAEVWEPLVAEKIAAIRALAAEPSEAPVRTLHRDSLTPEQRTKYGL